MILFLFLVLYFNPLFSKRFECPADYRQDQYWFKLIKIMAITDLWFFINVDKNFKSKLYC
jgi:hypothetical protein